VLSALRAGLVFVSAQPSGPQLFLDTDAQSRSELPVVRVRAVDARRAALLLISADGVEHAAPISSDDWSTRFTLPAHPSYLRAQVMDERGQVLALSNPVYPT
jgi:hypothetical protein